MLQNTEKFSITPPVEMAHLIHEKVNVGIFSSNSELIIEAKHHWIEEDESRNVKLEQLRQDINEGLENGEASTWNPEEIKTEACK